jgi:ubiquinone/menaquinone biosynthesis C-methylase UbiE
MSQSQQYQSYHGYVDSNFLKIFAERRREHKRQIYQRMDIRPGQRILDIGCGPGTDTIPLAHLVGQTGHVAGIDQDETMVDEADRQAKASGVGGWVEHKVGDVLALPFADDHFDVCHAERVMLHLSEPAQAFAEIIRVTKPGGRIVLLDLDGASFSVETPEVETERRIAEAWIRFHNNSYAGRQLYGLFKKHRFRDVSVEISPLLFESLAAYQQIFRLDGIASKAIEAGMMTRDELERFEASLEEAEEMGGFFAYGIFVTVVGSKP